MMFFLGNKLDDKTTMDNLKEKHNAKAFFWGLVDHQNDENITMFKIDSIYNKEKKQTIAFA